MMPVKRLLVLIAIGAAACGGQSFRSPQEQQLFELVNRERVRAGVTRLVWNDLMADAARTHAKRMMEHRALSHQFPGEPSLFVRLGTPGLRFNSTAENVSMGPGVEGNHDGLMRSPGHRENLLNPEYNAIGIGIVERGNTLYIAENFAHVFPNFSETEFREAVGAAFNRARRANRLAPVNLRFDDRLRQSACAHGADTEKLSQQLSGISLIAAFTASDPESLSVPMQKAAGDPNIRGMSLGVCFRPGGAQGFANFWVVAAFYANE
jgi:hypothetical protein